MSSGKFNRRQSLKINLKSRKFRMEESKNKDNNLGKNLRVLVVGRKNNYLYYN